MKNKKWELLKKAYDNYPKGTKFKSAYDGKEFTSSGCFVFHELNDGSILNTSSGCIYDGDKCKWAEIITEEKPKSILDGKVAIQVNNERDYLLMQKYCNANHFFDGGNIWKTWRANVLYFNLKDRSVGLSAYSEYTIIQFADFAKEVGIEVPKFVMKSEDGVDLYEGYWYWNVYNHHLNNEWILGAKVQLPFAKACIREPNKFKAFSTKQTALDWIEKQNKPKQKEVEIISHKSGNRFKITIDKVYVVDSSIGLTDLDIDVLYQATKTIRR